MPIKSHAPKVQITALLRESLERNGYFVDNFCDYFGQWKALGEAGEFSDPYFGKDGLYEKPTINGRRVLRHVHLPPENNAAEVADWDDKASRCSRKTSDTCLVYAYDPRNGYLLIYIAREPKGHELAQMATKESADLMNNFARVAEAFIHNGSILI